jgi:hypothetical protein
MEENESTQSEVRLEFPFDNCSFGFAVFNHAVNRLELCMVDAGSTQILMSIGTFETLDQVQEEYKNFVDTFTMAMRKIEWNS